MTAELADGWLPILFIPERAREVWGDVARRRHRQARPGARPAADQRRRHGRDRRGRARGCSTSCGRCTRCTSAAWAPAARTSTTSSPSHYGYEKEAKEIQDLYLDGKKKEAEALVPMEWMEQSNLVGPASYVQERIAAFKEAGVSHLSIVPATDEPGRDDLAAQGLGVVSAGRSGWHRAGGSTTSTRSGPSTPTTTPTATGSSPSPAATTSRGTSTRAPRSRSCATTACRRSPGCWTGPGSSRTTASSGTTTRCSSRRRRSSRASTPSASRTAVRRLNRIHGHYDIPNDEFQYVLATTIVGPVRWISRYGWRELDPIELVALTRFTTRFGELMGITGLPETYDGYLELLTSLRARAVRVRPGQQAGHRGHDPDRPGDRAVVPQARLPAGHDRADGRAAAGRARHGGAAALAGRARSTSGCGCGRRCCGSSPPAPRAVRAHAPDVPERLRARPDRPASMLDELNKTTATKESHVA